MKRIAAVILGLVLITGLAEVKYVVLAQSGEPVPGCLPGDPKPCPGRSKPAPSPTPTPHPHKK